MVNHPRFDHGTGAALAATSSFAEGASWMLESIRGSLRAYPHGGGDVGVMQEVDRLIKAAEARASERREGGNEAPKGGSGEDTDSRDLARAGVDDVPGERIEGL